MAKQPPQPEVDEQAQFEEAMAGVQPIERDRHLPQITFRTPTSISEREREVLRELDRIVSGEEPFEPGDSDEFMEGAVRGFDPRTVRQLRRGEFTLQADLDLHGLDAATARPLLERFIGDCHARGLRCVRVVHGKGRNSPDGVPVLKANLPRWLARGPARLLVLAYTSAQPKDGGTGATYVLLRSRGGRRRKRGSL